MMAGARDKMTSRPGDQARARLDIATSREVTPVAVRILEGEHGLEHVAGARDDLCPLCISFRKRETDV